MTAAAANGDKEVNCVLYHRGTTIRSSYKHMESAKLNRFPAEDPADLRLLDIGCGEHKISGAIGMDVNPRTAADVIHDLDDVPYPFSDNRFDQIVGRHVIEHVQNPTAVMGELHRITRPGGLIRLVAPHWTNPDFATDLTHRNHINSYSFRNFTDDSAVFAFYTDVRFRQRSCRVTVLNVWKACGVELLINSDQRYPRLRFLRKFWEQYLNAFMRGKEIQFELEVVKSHIDSSGA